MESEQAEVVKESLMVCQCSTWAKTSGRAEDIVNHHPSCPNRGRYDGVREVCRKAAEFILWWGSQEDGVPDEGWDVYQQLRMMGGLPLISDIPPEPPPAKGTTKEFPCSNESQGGGNTNSPKSKTDSLSVPVSSSPESSSASCSSSSPTSNPPAWEESPHWNSAAPAFIEQMRSGERTRGNKAIPTPPEAKCDGSGIVTDLNSPKVTRTSPCPGCPACKPKPDDAEEVLQDAGDAFAQKYFRGKPNPGESAIDFLARLFTAAIRADRAARPDLDKYKVYELARRVLNNPDTTQGVADLAHKVLAQLEAK